MDAATELTRALRNLWRSPALSLTAVLTLAIAIGAVLAVAGVIQQTLLRPWPVHEPDRLLSVYQVADGQAHTGTPVADFLDLERAAASDATFAYFIHPSLDDEMTHTRGDGPELVSGVRVSPNFFDVLGARFHLGGSFAGEVRGIVLGHAAWPRRFGADPAIVGRSLVMDDGPRVVTGVLPADFVFPRAGAGRDFWVSRALEGRIREDREAWILELVARPAAALSPSSAAESIAAIGARLLAETGSGGSAWVASPLVARSVAWLQQPLELIALGVLTLLAVACLNLGYVLDARLIGRQHDVAVQLALGAGRARIARALFVEAWLLVAIGAAAGLWLARTLVAAVVALSPSALPRVDSLHLSPALVGRAAILSAVCAIGLSVLPVWRVFRAPVSTSLRPRGTSAPIGRRVPLVITGQAALAGVLIAGALMTGASFGRLIGVDPGFARGNAVAIRVSLPSAVPRAQVLSTFDAARDAIARLPGVTAVGEVSNLPLTPASWSGRLYREGQPAATPGTEPAIDWEVASAGYFEAAGIRVIRGRPFTASDGPESPPVTVINETMARQFWPGEDPVGRRISGESPTGPFRTIIGIVADVRQKSLEQPRSPQMWVSSNQMFPWPARQMIVRLAPDAAITAGAVAAAVRAVEPNAALGPVRTLDDLVASSLAASRLTAALGGGLGLIGVVLAALSMAGVVAHHVAARTRELGVRVALGAAPGRVTRGVLTWTLAPVCLGGAAGLAAVAAVDAYLARPLYGVSAVDPLIVLSAGTVLAIVALAAALAPATRVSRIDPVQALRTE